MKINRKSVFETNSSSTHSISIEQRSLDNNNISPSLPINRSSDVRYFDILRFPLVTDGVAEDEISKLRIFVAITTEYIYYEYNKKLREDWVRKNNLKSYSWSYAFNDFTNEKLKSASAKSYMFNHRLWKYLNTYLKRKLNINISLYEKYIYFPYISEFVDDGQGAETNQYYTVFGWGTNLTREKYLKTLEEIVFNPNISIYQEVIYD